ncbi:MAG TPA: zf-HC2 domain-containing protein, partial [Bryobacteraceae bacterium]|nr:zf-HC2 domain-containing protein [Bryobacteraceae bacterium]
MECYSEQTCALAVDGELAADEAQRLRDHLTTCQRCRALVDTLRAENRVLSESLNELPEETASLAGEFSPRRWSWGWGDLAILAALLVLGSIISGWFNELYIPAALDWFNPFSTNGRTNLIFHFFDYFAHGGTAMLADYAAVVGWICLLLLLGGSALLLGRRGRPQYPGMRLLIVLLALSLPSFALERRHGDFVTVAANETVDDTLLATANMVRMDGVVNGDLLTFGRTVEVRGTVKGDLISFAQRTEVSGTVEGHIFTVSHTLDLEGQLGHSIYGAVQSLHIDDRGRVGDGVVVAVGEATLEGEVKRSVNIVTGGSIDVTGSIGRDLTMIGRSLTLTNTARVGGNLSARVRQLNEVHIADGATIVGKRDIQVRVRESSFTRPRFYFHQAVWLAGAILVGWLGMLLFPGFFHATTQLVGSGWRSLGVGVGVLAGVPVAIVVIAVTLVGFPLSLMLLAMYLAAIYLAKIWVGAFLGRIVLKPSGATTGDWLL